MCYISKIVRGFLPILFCRENWEKGKKPSKMHTEKEENKNNSVSLLFPICVSYRNFISSSQQKAILSTPVIEI